MEMDDIATVGLVGLGVYLLYKLLSQPPVAKFGPSEVVTSKVTYPEEPFFILGHQPPQEDERYPGYMYDSATGDYVDMETGQHLMID